MTIGESIALTLSVANSPAPAPFSSGLLTPIQMASIPEHNDNDTNNDKSGRDSDNNNDNDNDKDKDKSSPIAIHQSDLDCNINDSHNSSYSTSITNQLQIIGTGKQAQNDNNSNINTNNEININISPNRLSPYRESISVSSGLSDDINGTNLIKTSLNSSFLSIHTSSSNSNTGSTNTRKSVRFTLAPKASISASSISLSPNYGSVLSSSGSINDDSSAVNTTARTRNSTSVNGLNLNLQLGKLSIVNGHKSIDIWDEAIQQHANMSLKKVTKDSRIIGAATKCIVLLSIAFICTIIQSLLNIERFDFIKIDPRVMNYNQRIWLIVDCFVNIVCVGLQMSFGKWYYDKYCKICDNCCHKCVSFYTMKGIVNRLDDYVELNNTS